MFPLERIGDPPLVQVPDIDESCVLLRPDGGEAVSVIGLRPFLDHAFGCSLTRDGVEKGSPDVFGFASGVEIEADPSVMAKMDDNEGTCFLSHVIPATLELPLSNNRKIVAAFRNKLPKGDLRDRGSVGDPGCSDLNDLAPNHLANRVIAIH